MRCDCHRFTSLPYWQPPKNTKCLSTIFYLCLVHCWFLFASAGLSLLVMHNLDQTIKIIYKTLAIKEMMHTERWGFISLSSVSHTVWGIHSLPFQLMSSWVVCLLAAIPPNRNVHLSALKFRPILSGYDGSCRLCRVNCNTLICVVSVETAITDLHVHVKSFQCSKNNEQNYWCFWILGSDFPINRQLCSSASPDESVTTCYQLLCSIAKKSSISQIS